MILVHLHEPVTINKLKKTAKSIKHMVPEQMMMRWAIFTKNAKATNKLKTT